MQSIDALIDAITTQAALESGVPMKIMQARNGDSIFVPGIYIFQERPSLARWSTSEKQFLLEKIGLMTDGEIGEALGRSAAAIKIKRQRWGMPAHSKRPGWLTGHGAGKVLGLDIHAIMLLHERGILPMQVVPGVRGILNIQRKTLYRWAVQPKNWIYFRREQVRDLALRKLLERQAERWGDEWWTAGQACEFLGLEYRQANYLVQKRKLKGKKYGNWWFRKSEVMRRDFVYHFGKGHGHEVDFSPGQDEFIMLAAAVGISFNAIDQMMKWNRGADSNHRWHKALMGEVANGKWQMAGLQTRGEDVFVDWREQRGRFPAVARAMGKFERGENMAWKEIFIMRGVLAKWMDWYGVEGPRMVSARWAKRVAIWKLWEMVARLRGAGVDPLGSGR